MAKFEEIDEARRLLGLGESATLKELEQAYRRKAFRYHPDRNSGGNSSEQEEMMKKLNRAYELLTDYCTSYKYPFSKEEVARTYPYDEYLKNYYNNWFNSI
jgi:DnaJ-class molecular chaperone